VLSLWLLLAQLTTLLVALYAVDRAAKWTLM
jgi:hypothetical protein